MQCFVAQRVGCQFFWTQCIISLEIFSLLCAKQSLVSLNNLLSRKSFIHTIEQLTLLILIIGRWMLPKGVISRDQLSQLLLVYFGISFDIMELFYLFDEHLVIVSRTLQYVILTIWTGSLLQFTIVLTTIKTRRQRLSGEMRGGRGLLHRMTQWRCCQTEIWGLLTIIILQDGPFLALRLYCFSLGIFGYSLLFYTVKNVLIVVLEAYRFTVLVLRCSRPGFDRRQPRKDLSATYWVHWDRRETGSNRLRPVTGTWI